MKKRLLFVDDDPLVLAQLQRFLRFMRKEWDMVFASSGPEALAFMDLMPFDIVLADMRMPIMNGAQLLHEVMLRHPRTLRFVMATDTERDLAMQCAAAAHQFLPKPCNLETLQAVIRRTLALGRSLQNELIKKLVIRMRVLPSLPSLYYDMMERLKSEDASVESIGEVLSRDPGITARLLQLTNSAFFAARRPVASVTEAVSLLGIETVKALVLWSHIDAQYHQITPADFSLERFARHSLAVGLLARRIAQDQAADPHLSDEAFCAGILHDVGRLVLVVNLPNECRQARITARSRQVPLFAAEVETFQVTHAEVGAYLLGLWGLPTAIVEAVALHHSPSQVEEPAFAPLTAVHIADVLDHETGGADTGPGPFVDLTYLDRLGLADQVPAWRERFGSTAPESQACACAS